MDDRSRQKFGAEELAVVLSHYDLGVLESVTEFARGSSRSPKVGIVSERGKFILKKRASKGRSERKVSFGHAVQRHLAERGFPISRLMAARDNGDAVLRLGEDAYELFEFIEGHEYDGTIGQTRDAGRTLAAFHECLSDFSYCERITTATYHDTVGVRTSLNAVSESIVGHDSVAGREVDLDTLTEALFELYDAAAERANACGVEGFALQVIHGDWHPGNLLFKRESVVAVVDFDSCRLGSRMIDVANGAAHFSLAGGGVPESWPDAADMERLEAFVGGYQGESPLSGDEVGALPHLMIEALIGESVFPVAQTGSFGRFSGYGFLKMVARKSRWIEDQAEVIVSVAEARRG